MQSVFTTMNMSRTLITLALTMLGSVHCTYHGQSGRYGRCIYPGRPDNGYAYGSNRIGGALGFCCRPGYLLQGSSSLRCLRVNGQSVWSGALPKCVSEGK